MRFDVFFSISQTPVDGFQPPEREMFQNFFAQVEAADELGYGVAWIAESHLSSEVQKRNKQPVIPHWKGEVGLNVDFPQLASQVFRRTRRIEVGAAVMNIVCMGGPIAHAERISAFCSLHGLDAEERRRLHVGFSAGRFDFMNRASGILPRNALEAAAGRALKGKIFSEACEVFLRLLRGDTISSEDIAPRSLSRSDFRDDASWERVQAAAAEPRDSYEIPRRWEFEDLKIVPQEWRRELLQLVIGSHDPRLQVAVNEFMPVQVFNLSITKPEVIEETHQRMRAAYHEDGGAWRRDYMPRTVMVFLNEEEGLSPEERSAAAKGEAESALAAYWTALEGTLDPAKVANATQNAVIGNAAEVAAQISERFDPEDRLMLWFDFFNHDCVRVISNMTKFMELVVPQVKGRETE